MILKALLFTIIATGSGLAKESPVTEALKKHKIAGVTLLNAQFGECLEYLRIRSQELISTLTPVNFNFVGLAKEEDFKKAEFTILFKKEYSPKNISLFDLLEAVVTEAKFSYSITPMGVELHPKDFEAPKTPLANAIPKDGQKALNQIIIPQISFRNPTLEEAAIFLEIRTKSLDAAGKGFEFTLSPGLLKAPQVIHQLDVRQAPLKDLLDLLCRMNSLDYTLNQGTVVLSQAKEQAAKK